MVLVGMEMGQVVDEDLVMVMGLVVGQIVEVPLAMETAKASMARDLMAKVPVATARAVGVLLEHESSSHGRYKGIRKCKQNEMLSNKNKNGPWTIASCFYYK